MAQRESKRGFSEGLGEFINARRQEAALSLRQLADLAGVSNPYLSQIERGLRKPSAEVLQQLAKALQLSAHTLYIQAGILSPDDSEPPTVVAAIRADPALNDRQQQVLLDVYASFTGAENHTDQEEE